MTGLFALLFCIFCSHAAESVGIGKHEDNSGITFVQIKPLINRNPQHHTNSRQLESFRTSRIENIPLQIKPILTQASSNTPEIRIPTPEVVRMPRSDDKVAKSIEQTTEEPEKSTDYEDRNNESEVRFDTSEAVPPSVEDTAAPELPVFYQKQQISTPQDNDLIKPGGFYIKDGVLLRKSNPGKFSAVKKYYGGNFEAVEPAYRKYLETRRFRSRCRCEKISNCPKLQISVPRCPEEYFMCCF